MRRRLFRGCLIAVPLLAGIVVTASSAVAAVHPTARAGGIGVRLLAVPGGSNRNPLARSYIVARLVPGTSIRRRVAISNTTRSTALVSIYPAGAGVHRGAFAFAPGHRPNELSSWTSVNRDTLRLAPGGTAFETVRIKVPRGASSGERDAVVWAQVSAPAPAGGGITLVNRVGVRVYVSVGPGGAPPASFTIGPLAGRRSGTGHPLVLATVRNSGQRTLDISGSLILSGGPGGLRAGPFPVKLAPTLAPNDAELATVQLDRRLPRGPWHAHIRLTSGTLTRTAAGALTFPGPTSTAGGPSHPTPAAIVLLVLLGLVAVALVFSRHVRQSRRRELTRAA
jgi:hypothetical protein